jgi:hypothetical protein
VGRRVNAALIASVALFTGVTGAHAQPADWPHPATKRTIIKKIGKAQWNKAVRVAYCETGKTVNWYLTGKFRGALGMYSGTWMYGVKATGYDGNTFPEQVGIAIGAHPITGGWSGWGCGGA